eukprot:6412558-Amphidinium_carterae.1
MDQKEPGDQSPLGQVVCQLVMLRWSGVGVLGPDLSRLPRTKRVIGLGWIGPEHQLGKMKLT